MPIFFTTRWKVPLACKKLSLYCVELVKNNRCCFFSLLLYSILCACKLGLACLEDESSAPSKSLMLLFRDIAYTTKLLSDLLLLLLLCRRACLVYVKVTRHDRLGLTTKEATAGSDWGSYVGWEICYSVTLPTQQSYWVISFCCCCYAAAPVWYMLKSLDMIGR